MKPILITIIFFGILAALIAAAALVAPKRARAMSEMAVLGVTPNA